MALKKETRQVPYSTRISVNRGSGYASLSNAYKSRSDAFDQLTNAFAGTMLEEIQNRGKKIGKEAAENVQFVPDESGYRVPVETFKPRTRSEQEVYERDLANRYILEATKQGKQIVAERAMIAKNNFDSQDKFDQDLLPLLDNFYSTLPANVRTVAETYIEDYRHQNWLSVYSNHQAEERRITNEQDSANADEIYRNVRLGADLQTELSQLNTNGQWYRENGQTYTRDITGLSNYIKWRSTRPEFQKSIIDMTPSELQDMLDLSQAVKEVLAGGPMSNILSEISTEELNSWFPTDSLASKEIAQLNIDITDINRRLTLDRQSTVLVPTMSSVIDSGNIKSIYVYPRSEIVATLDSGQLDAKIIEAFGGDIDPENLTFAAGTIRSLGVVKTPTANYLNQGARSNESEFYQNFYNSGIGNALFAERRISENDDGETVIDYFDFSGNVNLNQDTVDRLRVAHYLMQEGYTAEQVSKRFVEIDNANRISFTNSELIKAHGRYDSTVEFESKIMSIADDYMSNIRIADTKLKNEATNLPKNKNMVVSLRLNSRLKEFAYNHIRKGGEIKNDSELEQLIGSHINGIVNGSSSEYGVSKWNWSQDGLSPYIGDSGKISYTSYSISLYPLEETARLEDGDNTWIEPIIYEKIKQSTAYKNDTDRKLKGSLGTGDFVLGKKIRVDLIDDLSPPVYTILFEDDGVIEQFNLGDDIDNEPIYIDIEKEKAKELNRRKNQ